MKQPIKKFNKNMKNMMTSEGIFIEWECAMLSFEMRLPEHKVCTSAFHGLSMEL